MGYVYVYGQGGIADIWWWVSSGPGGGGGRCQNEIGKLGTSSNITCLLGDMYVQMFRSHSIVRTAMRNHDDCCGCFAAVLI